MSLPRPARSASRFAVAAGLAALSLLAPARARAERPWVSLAVPPLLARSEKSVAATPMGSGVELRLDVMGAVLLPLDGVEELELDYDADGLFCLTWASATAGRIESPYGLLWRYVRLERGRGTVRLDARWTEGWSLRARPTLIVSGTGRLRLTGLRARQPSPSAAVALLELDRARLLAPESFGHVTVNSFAPPMWRVSEGATLWDRLGWAFVALAVLAVAVASFQVRRWRAAGPLAAVILAAVVLADAHAVLKLAPPWRLGVTLDPEVRLRDGYPFAPEVGALAALARATLRPGDRVEVQGGSTDWFGPQTLCFHLAPRPCVISKPGVPTAGISGVDHLGDDEVDAIVSYNSEVPLPSGFVRVAQVSDHAFVARRP